MFKLTIILTYITLSIAIGVILATLSLVLNFKQMVKISNELGSQYECGFIPFTDSRIQFEVQFYLVALLFIIFDVEISLILPYCLVLLDVGSYGFYVLIYFFLILGLGFLFEWKSGILNLELKGARAADKEKIR